MSTLAYACCWNRWLAHSLPQRHASGKHSTCVKRLMHPDSSVQAKAAPWSNEHSHDGSSWPRVRPIREVWYSQSGISANVARACSSAFGRSKMSLGGGGAARPERFAGDVEPDVSEGLDGLAEATDTSSSDNPDAWSDSDLRVLIPSHAPPTAGHCMAQ